VESSKFGIVYSVRGKGGGSGGGGVRGRRRERPCILETSEICSGQSTVLYCTCVCRVRRQNKREEQRRDKCNRSKKKRWRKYM